MGCYGRILMRRGQLWFRPSAKKTEYGQRKRSSAAIGDRLDVGRYGGQTLQMLLPQAALTRNPLHFHLQPWLRHLPVPRLQFPANNWETLWFCFASASALLLLCHSSFSFSSCPGAQRRYAAAFAQRRTDSRWVSPPHSIHPSRNLKPAAKRDKPGRRPSSATGSSAMNELQINPPSRIP
ncbi:hypothetical protein GGI35DRAFT_152602 [Trichoderma velutinum]